MTEDSRSIAQKIFDEIEEERKEVKREAILTAVTL